MIWLFLPQFVMFLIIILLIVGRVDTFKIYSEQLVHI